MRRTASWSTSDAFTDGHIVEGSEALMPGLRTKAATSRAHGFRRYHQGTMGRSSSDALSRSFDVSPRTPIRPWQSAPQLCCKMCLLQWQLLSWDGTGKPDLFADGVTAVWTLYWTVLSSCSSSCT